MKKTTKRQKQNELLIMKKNALIKKRNVKAIVIKLVVKKMHTRVRKNAWMLSKQDIRNILVRKNVVTIVSRATHMMRHILALRSAEMIVKQNIRVPKLNC